MAYSNFLSSQLGGPIIPGQPGGTYTSSGQPVAGPGLGWHGDSLSSGQIAEAAIGPAPAQDTSNLPTNPQVNEVVDGMRWTGTGWENANQGSGGGGGADPYSQIRSEIEGGYSNYEQQLDQMLNESLPAQGLIQGNIAKSQLESGIRQLGEQKEMGEFDLQKEGTRVDKQTTKSLKDISTNLRNSFMAGNNFLGTLGAGDSSATNQYAYALTKMGNKSRGDVQNQAANYHQEIADKSWKLGRIHDSEVKNITDTYNQQSLSIAQWLAEQQDQIRLNKAELGINKSQDLANLSSQVLDRALAALEQVKLETSNRRSSLEQWSMNNASNLTQLKQNLQGVSQFTAGNISNQPISGQPIKTGLFQNPSWYPGGRASTDEETRA